MKMIAYSKYALKALRRMPGNTATLTVSRIEQFATSPASLGNNIRQLKGRPGEFRMRVGDWRVIMTEAGEVIAVIKIGPRGSVHED